MGKEVRVVPGRWLPRGEVLVEKKGFMPLTVWSGIPGERSVVDVVHEGQNQAHGLWRSSPEPDPHRVEPVCDRYRLCGGCPIMHLDAEGQEKARRAIVADAFAAEGVPVTLGAWHPSPDGLEDFRHVVKVGAGYSDRGRIRVGAWGRRDKSIIPIPACPVAAPGLNRVMKSLAHWVIDLEIRPYDPASGRGVLRAAVMRQSRSTGHILITLVAARRIRALSDLADEVSGGVAEVVGVWLHLNDANTNTLFVRDEASGEVKLKPLAGKATIDETLDGITYRIGPGDFFQTNPAVAEVLYRRVLERLPLKDGVPFVDLYAGVGALTLQAARRTGWALGVEQGDGAVIRARESARHNKISAEFLAGRVEDLIPDIAKRLARSRPVVAVDPARRGLEEGVIDAILTLRPRAIAYISCNARAAARDLKRFRAAGFEIGEMELFDMFPNTAHVESFTVLTAPGASEGVGRGPRRRLVR